MNTTPESLTIRLTGVLAGLLLVVGLLATSAAAQDGRRGGDRRDESREPDAFAEQYAVLLENNIFLRDRRAPREPSTRPAQPEAPPPPAEKSWMLVGVVFEEGTFHAYFEDLRSNSVTRTTLGEQIANGSVSELFIDAVAYSTEQGVKWIEIGQDLTGVYPEGLTTKRPAGATAAGASGSRDGGQPNQNTMSIEERLRQRRLQESGGAAPAGQAVQVQMKDGVIMLPPGQAVEGAAVRWEVAPVNAREAEEIRRRQQSAEDPPERGGRGDDPDDDPDEPPERGGGDDPDDGSRRGRSDPDGE